MTDQTELVKELVLRYVGAIQTQDKSEFCGLWAENPDCALVALTSQYLGVEAIYQDFLLGRIQASYKTIRLVPESIDVHLLREDLATVIFQYHTECVRREDGADYGIRGLETQVAVKAGGEWKLQHIHYSK